RHPTSEVRLSALAEANRRLAGSWTEKRQPAAVAQMKAHRPRRKASNTGKVLKHNAGNGMGEFDSGKRLERVTTIALLGDEQHSYNEQEHESWPPPLQFPRPFVRTGRFPLTGRLARRSRARHSALTSCTRLMPTGAPASTCAWGCCTSRITPCSESL